MRKGVAEILVQSVVGGLLVLVYPVMGIAAVSGAPIGVEWFLASIPPAITGACIASGRGLPIELVRVLLGRSCSRDAHKPSPGTT